ncbi:probable replication factor C subunit 1 isoform X2 [Drosophila ficusphila]|uniref:probable replication factor C subunit 1 isoform X2 n=1 Tax=Drosophila ficusphila TaxID=30025 RepID=UPI0007E7169E|nr:probable replication factor C subunit 1 isoform X2 [Drosophila ficusphila]
MAERNLLAILLLASICMAQAYPALLPYIYNPSKRSDTAFPQIEDDVSELDQLRNEPGAVVAKRQHDGSTARTTTTTKESVEEVAAAPEPGQSPNANILPDLERQLEVATPLISTTTTTSTSATTTTATSKEEGERSQLEEPKTQIKTVVEPTAHAKAFYGAARLAFGQNPEVLPTTTTTSTTTTSTTTTTTPAPPAEPEPEADAQPPAEPEAKEEEAETDEEPAPEVAGEPAEAEDPAGEVAETELTHLNPQRPKQNHHESNKETIGDIVFDVVSRTTERRSSTPKITAKTAKNLLRSPNGQYSSFDMAQYIYWTGDETAVVKAVQELVEGKVITRESALKFLQDIRLGIEFLQRSYANRIFPEEVRQNQLKRHSPAITTPPTTSTTTTTTTTTSTTTEKPFPEVRESGFESGSVQGAGVLPAKNFDSFTFWNKLKVLDSEAQQDLNDYDEGRAKIVEYLYNEYSLEEILYKLAKVMFAQSLSHGSDEAQMELQKLTEFLEREGNMGVIPIDLQKKVLRVLLSALSDTLTEHPELLPAARVNLANPFYRLPMHTPSQ